MKLYLAGPMRGHERWNFPAFDKATVVLRSIGHEVLSPAEHDRESGFSETDEHVTPGFLRQALRWDIGAILRVEGVALLPGWEKSKGVAIELTVARAIGLPIYEYIDGSLWIVYGGRSAA